MINSSYIVLIFLTFFHLNNSNQKLSGEITYGKEIRTDFSGIPVSKEIKDSKGKTGLEYSLKFSDSEASFKIKETLNNDFNQGYSFSKSIGGGKGIYYFNGENQTRKRQFEAFGETFLLSNFLNSLDWKITKDTMTIGGFLCRKANAVKIDKRKTKTFTKPITAWFTTEIPLSYGPIGYNGLPGLILDLDIQNEVRFYAKTINLKKKYKISEPTKGIKMTEIEFRAKSKEMYEARKNSFRKKKK